MVVKIYKTGFVQISTVSIIHLVVVMETAIVTKPHVSVMQDLVDMTVQLILQVRNCGSSSLILLFLKTFIKFSDLKTGYELTRKKHQT